jgi:hypothetical protein
LASSTRKEVAAPWGIGDQRVAPGGFIGIAAKGAQDRIGPGLWLRRHDGLYGGEARHSLVSFEAR